MDKRKLGSTTAKGGFANEKKICDKFNNWKSDNEARLWLEIMGYDLNRIDFIKAINIPVRIRKSDLPKYGLTESEYEKVKKFKKADAQVQIKVLVFTAKILRIENISLKKANSNWGYNQVDKRSIDSYRMMWGFDEEISYWLKLFSGEILPQDVSIKRNIIYRNNKRIFFDEMPKTMSKKVIKFFERNKILVVSDIIKGRGSFSADWMLVTMYNKKTNVTDWVLKDINTAMNFFGKDDIKISRRGSLYIGKITMQRKGGTPDPTKLQFKINPCALFELENKHNERK